MLQMSLMMLSGWNRPCTAASHQQGALQPLLLPLLCLFKPPPPPRLLFQPVRSPHDL